MDLESLRLFFILSPLSPFTYPSSFLLSWLVIVVASPLSRFSPPYSNPSLFLSLSRSLALLYIITPFLLTIALSFHPHFLVLSLSPLANEFIVQPPFLRSMSSFGHYQNKEEERFSKLGKKKTTENNHSN
jgi:hypothetical protein